MSRPDEQPLADVRASLSAIGDHLTRGDLADGLVFDAVRVRLIEIGEALKGVSPALLATEPGVPWRQITSMRDQLAHRYPDTSHAVVAATVAEDLPHLAAAVDRLTSRASDSGSTGMR